MFVLTAVQIDNRNRAERAKAAVELLNQRYAASLPRPVERTSADELSAFSDDPGTVLEMTLDLNRDGHWSIGVGIDTVRMPATALREAAGAAITAANEAVSRAKKLPIRFALTRVDDGSGKRQGQDVEALIALLLQQRERRTEGGWELYDLLQTGMSQAEAAEQLGITPGAASLRGRAAGLRVEKAASAALIRLLGSLDGAPGDEVAQ